MIETMHLTKTFYGAKPVKAVNDVSLTIKDGEVFGLVGTNGAGKSTFLRLLSGVLQQDCGNVLVDREPVFDNPESKKKIFFVPSEPFWFPNSCAMDMGIYYAGVYEDYDMSRFIRLLKDFSLDPERKISEFSKGMQRQLAIILGVCAGTHYLLLDETFDGLDPVMRQAVKSLLAKDMTDRNLTPVLSSHNLRELEDICDHIGLLHQGGILLSENIDDMKLNIQKIQVVFGSEEAQKAAEGMLHILEQKTMGRLHTYIVTGERGAVETVFRSVATVFFEVLPLTLEEIFISETESSGYDIRKLIMQEQ